jgi:hypothetical protein
MGETTYFSPRPPTAGLQLSAVARDEKWCGSAALALHYRPADRRWCRGLPLQGGPCSTRRRLNAIGAAQAIGRFPAECDVVSDSSAQNQSFAGWARCRPIEPHRRARVHCFSSQEFRGPAVVRFEVSLQHLRSCVDRDKHPTFGCNLPASHVKVDLSHQHALMDYTVPFDPDLLAYKRLQIRR